jgi:hypothetical protein
MRGERLYKRVKSIGINMITAAVLVFILQSALIVMWAKLGVISIFSNLN